MEGAAINNQSARHIGQSYSGESFTEGDRPYSLSIDINGSTVHLINCVSIEFENREDDTSDR